MTHQMNKHIDLDIVTYETEAIKRFIASKTDMPIQVLHSINEHGDVMIDLYLGNRSLDDFTVARFSEYSGIVEYLGVLSESCRERILQAIDRAERSNNFRKFYEGGK